MRRASRTALAAVAIADNMAEDFRQIDGQGNLELPQGWRPHRKSPPKRRRP
jgi:hypothetical protein